MKNNLVSNFLNSLNGGDNITAYVKSMDFPSKLDLFDDTSSGELYEIFNSVNGDSNINFFPSPIKGGCYETAVFVSLSKAPNGKELKEDSLISLDVVLKKMVQQVLGTCDGINQEIILITDEINTTISKEWEGNLKAIKRRCSSLDIFYLFPDGEYKNVNDFFGV